MTAIAKHEYDENKDRIERDNIYRTRQSKKK